MNSIGVKYLKEVDIPHDHITIDGKFPHTIFHSYYPEKRIFQTGSGLTMCAEYARFSHWTWSGSELPEEWNQLLYEGEESIVVPVFICSSCMSPCYTIVAEVKKEKDVVRWLRIGERRHKKVGETFEDYYIWFDKIPPFVFDRKEYDAVLNYFQKSIETKYIKEVTRTWIRMLHKSPIPTFAQETTFLLEEIPTGYRFQLASYVPVDSDVTISDFSYRFFGVLSLGNFRFTRSTNEILEIIKEAIIDYYQHSSVASRHSSTNFIHFAKKINIQYGNQSFFEVKLPKESYTLRTHFEILLRKKLKNWINEIKFKSNKDVPKDMESFDIQESNNSFKISLKATDYSIIINESKDIQPILQYAEENWEVKSSKEILIKAFDISLRGWRRRGRRKKNNLS